jgi:hypothetical protein
MCFPMHSLRLCEKTEFQTAVSGRCECETRTCVKALISLREYRSSIADILSENKLELCNGILSNLQRLNPDY